ARFTMDLTRIRQATYVGGNSQTQLFAIATDPKTGDIVVSGQTRATNLPCTTAGGLCAVAAQNMPAGNADGFVARLPDSLTRFGQVTYFGGSADDEVHAIAIDPATGAVFGSGSTTSIDLPCTTAGATCANGALAAHASDTSSFDAFVVRITPDLALPD